MRGGARAHVGVGRPVVLDRPNGLVGNADRGLFADLEPALFLVDGNNLLWRAAHGHPAPFTAQDGRDLTPLFRFFSMLRRALGTFGLFAECIVCFDGESGWSSRVEIDPSYKLNRSYAGKDLSFMQWLPEIRAALSSAGVACIEMCDREADDVIASLAALAPGRHVRILSTDRDYFQLLGPCITIVSSKCAPALVDAGSVRALHLVDPAQWCDFRALAGDRSDGIPGVRGVGPKRAAALLEGGRTLDDLSGLLGDDWQDALRWRRLIRLQTDVPVPHSPRAVSTGVLPGPVAVCRELGLI